MRPSATTTVLSKRKLREFCIRHRIRKLAKLPPRSDRRVRILAEFERGARIGLFELVAAEHELSDLFARKVSIVTPGVFRNGARETLLREAQELYSATA